MARRRPLKATDKRRNNARADIESLATGRAKGSEGDGGEGHPLANLFTDRRKGRNGQGKRAG